MTRSARWALAASVTFAEGTIRGFGFAGGGTFKLVSPNIAFNADGGAGATEIPLDFLATTGFATLDRSDWWLGVAFGLAHAAVALAVLVPLLTGVNPRMASERAGPASTAVLEPPGLFSLNYGIATPLVALSAHVAYGAVLGLFLGSG